MLKNKKKTTRGTGPFTFNFAGMESPCESESSLDGGTMLPPSPVSREQLQKRIESLTQQNK